jgi:hypothetical protein
VIKASSHTSPLQKAHLAHNTVITPLKVIRPDFSPIVLDVSNCPTPPLYSLVKTLSDVGNSSRAHKTAFGTILVRYIIIYVPALVLDGSPFACPGSVSRDEVVSFFSSDVNVLSVSCCRRHYLWYNCCEEVGGDCVAVRWFVEQVVMTSDKAHYLNTLAASGPS